MLMYPTLYRLYLVIVSCQREPISNQTMLASAKRVMAKYAMQSFFFIIFSLFFTPANAQENSSQISTARTEVANLSDRQLLKQAKSYRTSDQQKSTKLANEALLLSTDNKNYRVNAQAHSLLGKLTRESNHIVQSMQHFLQASLIYKNINDKRNQIVSSVDYINLLFVKKRYNEAEIIINELLPIARAYGHALPLALTLTTKGDTYYQKKRYDDAIVQYTHALKYLSGHNKSAQQQLAETYKRIAQSYKRIENREQAAAFYNKTLDIYTALQDRRLMARTLNTLAEAERYLGNFVDALEHSTRGLELQKQVNDPVGRAKALVGAGIIYRHIGRYEKSLDHFNEAYLYYKKVDNASGIAKTSIQMGLIYTRLRKFDQARSFYQLTIDLPTNKIKPETLASALREMAVIDLNAKNYESAKVMAKKAYQIYKIENNQLKSSLSARIIGNIYLAQNYDSQAMVYFRESLSLATEVGNEIYQIKALTLLGRTLIGKNTVQAVAVLKKSLKLSEQDNIKEEKLSAYHSLRLAEKSRGNIAEALRYAEKEISLANIIYNEKETNELVRAKAKLDSHKMEMELDSLREKARLDQLELVKKNNEIEISGQAIIISGLELTKKRYANIALASLLAICLFVVIFIYLRFVDSRKRNRELDYLAARDPLTNCYNRRTLFDLMNRDFTDIELLGEYCLIMADIDHFKAVNDIYGHSAGDTVLRGVASILQSGVRQNDISARFGGEEFCLVLPGADQNQGMRIAETMCQKVAASRFDDITVTCSFGVTSIKFNAMSPTELIDQADLALYKSKSSGRNRVTLWNKTL